MAPCISRQTSGWSTFRSGLRNTHSDPAAKNQQTYEWLAYAEISTSCGMVLDPCRNLDDYPVSDGGTLMVILVLADELSELEAEEQAEERRLQALHAV